MRGLYRGAPKKGGPAPGSWGDRYIIENPNQRTSVSCSKCLNYCTEDNSCSVRPVFCPVDGWNLWKSCDLFELDEQYKTPDYMKKVRKVRGEDFFVRAKKRKTRIIIEKSRNKRTYQERVFHDEAFHLKPFITYVKGRLFAKYRCNFIKWDERVIGGEIIRFPLVSDDKKIYVSAKNFVYEGKSKKRKTIEDSIKNLDREVSLLNKLPEDILKIIVIVKVPFYEKGDMSVTMAQKYYEEHIFNLADIRVIEVDEDGKLEEII